MFFEKRDFARVHVTKLKTRNSQAFKIRYSNGILPHMP